MVYNKQLNKLSIVYSFSYCCIYFFLLKINQIHYHVLKWLYVFFNPWFFDQQKLIILQKLIFLFEYDMTSLFLIFEFSVLFSFFYRILILIRHLLLNAKKRISHRNVTQILVNCFLKFFFTYIFFFLSNEIWLLYFYFTRYKNE